MADPESQLDGTKYSDVLKEEENDDFDYGGVEIPSEDEDEEETGNEETFQDVMRNVQLQKEKEAPPDIRPVVTRQPEVLDDFFRNFLVKNALKRTLETFEAEWYEKRIEATHKEGESDTTLVPDVYLQNSRLEEEVEYLKLELYRTKEIAENTRAAWEKLKKERNYHKMSHNRVVQEKDRLIKQVKTLQAVCAKYDPMIDELRHKYEAANKEKMLLRLDRDKLIAKVTNLESTIKEIESNKSATQVVKKEGGNKKTIVDSPWPPDDRVNPFANIEYTNTQSPLYWAMRQSCPGHSMSVVGIALHPAIPACATVSDDHCWKMWNINDSELIMSSDEHRDWVAGVDFNPKGTHLATGSGDKTVKVWDFEKAKCMVTFKDHAQGVWSVCFHDTGNFVASASLDHTARIWDINSLRCRSVLRGHVDSVNCVTFLKFTNLAATCSGDKTVSMWDPRTAYCSHTFFGHENACNSVAFAPRGDILASTDADGKVNVWDIRTVRLLKSYECGPHPANGVCFDSSSTFLAAASDDSSIKMIHVRDDKEGVKVLRGHEDAVLQVRFDVNNTYLVSCGADMTWKVWS